MKCIVSSIMVMFCSLMLSAKSVTVHILQAGSGALCEETFAIEDAVMNAMFDLGHIVTNDAASLEKGKMASLNKAMDRALMGGSKYYVRFVVHYKDKTHSPEAVLMQNIECINWTSYDTRTKQKIMTGSETAAVPKKDSAESVAKYATLVTKNACMGIRD